MTNNVLLAVECVQARGRVPVPLEVIGDELTWSGSLTELEEQLDQLVAEARLKRRQVRSSDPEYWLVGVGGAARSATPRPLSCGVGDGVDRRAVSS